MGFEPTPSYEDQNAPYMEEKVSLESGALDRSAILTGWEDVTFLKLYQTSNISHCTEIQINGLV